MSNKYKIPNVTKYIQRRIDSLFSAIKKFIGSFYLLQIDKLKIRFPIVVPKLSFNK